MHLLKVEGGLGFCCVNHTALNPKNFMMGEIFIEGIFDKRVSGWLMFTWHSACRLVIELLLTGSLAFIMFSLRFSLKL